jgi:hypothetical protein
MRSRLKLRRQGPKIREVLLQEAKMFKITRIINLVDGSQLSRPSKGAKAAIAASSLNPSNVGCRDAAMLIGTTGEIAWFFVP